MSCKLRLRYCKTSRGKYISHLDLVATMKRAFLRAGLALTYSEGFNPHPYVSVALPLQVGCSSICELMDIGVQDVNVAGKLLESINTKLPDGIEILEAYIPNRKFSDIMWIEINGSLIFDSGAPVNIIEDLTERFMADSITIQKRTKRGTSDMDIMPFIRDAHFKRGDTVSVTAKLSAQNPSINPDDLVNALCSGDKRLLPDFSIFTRVEIYDKDINIFR